MSLERPVGGQPTDGRHLSDAGYWRPYVEEVLRRHSLPVAPLEAPSPGTFPTFLCGDLVVKLYGEAFDGEASARVEAAMHDLLADQPAVPAPRAVARGQLFDTSPRWAYLVSERVRGRPLREVELSADATTSMAASLGRIVRDLHRLPPPPEVAARSLVEELRRDAPERVRRFGLPDHLVDQVADFLADAKPPNRLVHGDITADHIFIADTELVAVIDWGDALVADVAYELPAIYLDALDGHSDHFATFLGAAEWPAADLARQGLQGVFEFQYNAIAGIAERIDLSAVTTLDELARRLFGRRPPTV